ncbi:hypothetical protein C5E07_18985 [Pseudoclavibacter sp. RFBJ3]|uniref:hypothetical protein n=1 Tax=unclassified Pseudoclavibacter TaxID=2615177 RepID=UPI000CE830C7|nr:MULTISPECIES: hypothetical protein [unclassified Pseudoclavibacter]PPF79557.1 hypothetical protein C5C12_18955 [Pseudoclavibacter sp. RFBJ5]PPF88519.1 hypothetical protein C5E07_18985 [Pseudoclavibacter sp. RFBJ3]PPF94240.1 hypothetical protein C5C19_18635 [Pseudoclavibacter sp. RFBH5]PPG18231.1 hypothetical protein C5E13_18440 [Pseudoclavibacter sp. RFBI4]
MTVSPDQGAALDTATSIAAQVERHHGLPRWYALASTLVFLFGVGIVTLGVVIGWFVPFLGVVVLTLNAASFPFLLASWRIRGVVPKDGRLARKRYWLVTPVTLVAMFFLWLVALTVEPNPMMWVWVAIVLPFTLEHINRLYLWLKR